VANVLHGVGLPIANGEGELREAFGQLSPLDPPREGRLGYLGEGFAHGVPTPISSGDGFVSLVVLPFSL